MERGLEMAAGAVGLLGLLVNVGFGSDSLAAAKWGAVVFLCAMLLVTWLRIGTWIWEGLSADDYAPGATPSPSPAPPNVDASEPPDAEIPATIAEARTIALTLASRFEERGLQSTVHPVEPRRLERYWRLAVDVVAPRVGAEIVVFADGAWEVTVRDRSDEVLDSTYGIPGNPPDFAAIFEEAYEMIVRVDDEASDPERAGASGGAPPSVPGEPPSYFTEESFARAVRVGVAYYARAGVASPERIYRRMTSFYSHSVDAPDSQSVQAERFTAELYPRMPEIVRRVVREELARHIQAQEGWGETDFDRLDRAFEELKRLRIATFPAVDVFPFRIARKDEGEWFEQQMKLISAEPWRGYVYWEEESAYHCFHYGRLKLPCRTTEASRLAGTPGVRELQEEVAGVLRDFGLRPILTAAGILVEFDWQRRRPLSDLAW
ncbi:MAG TPA: hypothetical protein VM899_05990 [Rubellimicrobium sp.]|nr:hypothetical protein [Rubellimicrobium sp.]